MKIKSILSAAAILAIVTGHAEAANGADTWTTGSGTGFLAGSNWTGTGTTNNPPISGDSWVFGATTGTTTLTDNLTTGTGTWTVAGITFSSGAASYTINPLSSSNGFILTGGITNSSSAKEIINDNIAVSGSQTWTATSNNSITILGGNLSGTGNIAITGNGSNGAQLPTFQLTGTNNSSYTGTISFTASQSGGVLLGSAGAMTGGLIDTTTGSHNNLWLTANSSSSPYTFGIDGTQTTGARVKMATGGGDGIFLTANNSGAGGGGIYWDPGAGSNYNWSGSGTNADTIVVGGSNDTNPDTLYLGNSSSQFQISGANKNFKIYDVGNNAGYLTLQSALSDLSTDTAQRTLTSSLTLLTLTQAAVNNSHPLNLTINPVASGQAGSLSISATNQLPGGNLSLSGGVLILNGLASGWDTFAAARTNGTGNGQYQLGSSSSTPGGFASVGNITIDTNSTSSTTFANGFQLGSNVLTSTGAEFATGSINLATPTTFGASTESAYFGGNTTDNSGVYTLGSQIMTLSGVLTGHSGGTALTLNGIGLTGGSTGANGTQIPIVELTSASNSGLSLITNSGGGTGYGVLVATSDAAFGGGTLNIQSATPGSQVANSGWLVLLGGYNSSKSISYTASAAVASASWGLGSYTGNDVYTGTSTIAVSTSTSVPFSLDAESGSTFQLGASGTPATFTNNSTAGDVLTYRKTGAGTAILNNVTFNGTDTAAVQFSIQNGTLQFATSQALASSNVTFGSSNTPTLDLDGNNSTIGLLAGTGTNGVVTNSGSSNVTLTLQGSGSQSYAGLIQNGGTNSTALTLSASNTGTQTLSNSNTFTGAVAVNAGILNFTVGNASATGAQSLGENANLTLGTAGTSSGMLEYSGTGAATLAKQISALGNGNDTIQGSTNIGALLTLTGGLVKNGTTLTLNGNTGGIKVTTNGISGSSANSDLDITGGVTTLAAASTYNGPTWIYGGGTLANGLSGGALPTSTSIDIGTPGVAGSATSTTTTAGTFDLDGNNQTVAGLNTEGTGTYASDIVTNSSTTTNATLTVSGGGTFAGVIKNGSDNTALTVSGGTLKLSGANTYTGGTTISAGNLIVSGSTASGSAFAVNGGTLTATGTVGGTVAVANGATLSGTGTTGAATLASGANINLVDGAIGTLTVGGLSTTAGNLTFEIGTSANSIDKIIAGTLTIGSGSTTINIDNLNNVASGSQALVSGNYTLLTYSNGTLPSNIGNLSLSTTSLDGDALSLSTSTLGSVILTVTAPVVTNGQYTLTTIAGATVIHTGGTVTLSTTIKNTGTGTQDSLNYSTLTATSSSGTVGTATGTTSGTALAQGSTSSPAASQTFTGTSAGSVTIGNSATVSNHSATGTPVGTFSGTTIKVYNLAAANTISTPVSLGYVHTGGTFGTSALSIQNTAAAGSYSEDLSASGTASGSASTSGSATILAGNSSTAVSVGLGGSANTGTAGTVSGSVAVGLTSTGTVNGVSNGLGTTSLTTQNVSVSGTVYSGLSTWTASTSGSWGTITGSTPDSAFTGNWDQGAPGVTTGFTGVDTATFGAHTSTPITVSLNSAAPNLNKITFSSPSTGYTLAQGTGSNVITLSGTTPSINVTGNATAGSQTISAPISLGANTSVNVGSKQTLNLTGAVSSSGSSLSYSGPGTTITTADNTYTGGTTISGGTLYVNNTGGASYSAPISNPHAAITATNSTGSGTGTGAVVVQSGGTLAGSGTIAGTAGITVQNGGTLSSGAIQSGTTAGQGLTINSNLSSALVVNGGATLTFALGSTTAYNGGSGALNFGNPNTDSTYLSIAGTAVDQIFSNTTTADNIDLVDLTNGSTSVSLTLRSQNPYLLIQTALGTNADFSNLWTTGGEGANGYVLGISTGVGNNYTGFNIAAYGINGNQVNTATNLQNLRLYLYNGDLEVVPEPGTWALMIGGLALLVMIQRLKRKKDSLDNSPVDRSAFSGK